MRSLIGSGTGAGRVALEVGLGACTLCLLAENALLLLVLGHHADWLQSFAAAKVALKVAAMVARSLWPWPAAVPLALILGWGLAFSALMRNDSMRVRHA
jgi:hypothetical protein